MDLILDPLMPVRAGQKLPVNPDIWAGVANVPFPRQAPPVRRREEHEPPSAWSESREERLRRDLNSSSEVMLVKRASTPRVDVTPSWELSQLSQHSGQPWEKSNNRAMLPHPNEPGNYIYSYYYSSEGGEGQYVYNMDDEIHPQHPVSLQTPAIPQRAERTADAGYRSSRGSRSSGWSTR